MINLLRKLFGGGQGYRPSYDQPKMTALPAPTPVAPKADATPKKKKAKPVSTNIPIGGVQEASVYNPLSDPLNPLNPLSPLNAANMVDPTPVAAYDPPAPSCDSSNSYDSSSSYSSDSCSPSSYDSGSSSYDSGSGSSYSSSSYDSGSSFSSYDSGSSFSDSGSSW